MATIPASENVFPILRFDEVAAPSTPPTGEVHLYAKADGLLYWKDDAGTEYAINTDAAGGLAAHTGDTSDAHDASAISVADAGGNFTGTDVEAVLAELDASIGAGGIPATIFDAKGDLIAASAADTAARLAVGANNLVLMADSAQSTGLKWAGTWSDFTPTLTGSVSNPTLGTGGTAVGRYVQIGNMVRGWARITFGTASVSNGSGTYLIALPVPMDATTTGAPSVFGSAILFDNSASTFNFGMVYYNNSTTVRVALSGTTLVVAATAPWTWAANDVITLHFAYEAD